MSTHESGLRRTSSLAATRSKLPGAKTMLALPLMRQPIDLARISRWIAEHPALSRRVTETARAEAGYAQIEIAEAVVLLGARRLGAILSHHVVNNVPLRAVRASAYCDRVLCCAVQRLQIRNIQ